MFNRVLEIPGAYEELRQLAQTYRPPQDSGFTKWQETALEKTGRIQDQVLDQLEQLEKDAAVTCAKREAIRKGWNVQDAIARATKSHNKAKNGRKSKKSRAKNVVSLRGAFTKAATKLASARQPTADPTSSSSTSMQSKPESAAPHNRPKPAGGAKKRKDRAASTSTSTSRGKGSKTPKTQGKDPKTPKTQSKISFCSSSSSTSSSDST